ncbi:MAG TPA: glycosyltransferase family 4 protein [Candidatus Angelobacter sp.]|jgi:glycosyltransferase involved in cell wall biosynthesis|nr:glycosyltransferase family 4 protein [Candidatus Angelobacter sp.]
MRIALVAPPFISVPPKKYGGTELFVGELAMGLSKRGVELTLYTNGESTLPVPLKWFYEKEEWPLSGEAEANLKGLNHAAWAVKEAAEADLIHLNNAAGLPLSHLCNAPVIYTVHHAYEEALNKFYEGFPDVAFVTISDFQRSRLKVPNVRTIHHGIEMEKYLLQDKKQGYVSFLGRIAPSKGVHLAIEIAEKSGMPLKIAGEIQPLYRDYWERQIKPKVDGRFIEYVGQVGLEEKNAFLGGSTAMLFPIQWDEPFGLVMIESMACGTPVLALPGGSVAEVVKEGVSGHVRKSAGELVDCLRDLHLCPKSVRAYVEENFSSDRMVEQYIELYSELLGLTEAEVDRVVA